MMCATRCQRRAPAGGERRRRPTVRAPPIAASPTAPRPPLEPDVRAPPRPPSSRRGPGIGKIASNRRENANCSRSIASSIDWPDPWSGRAHAPSFVSVGAYGSPGKSSRARRARRRAPVGRLRGVDAPDPLRLGGGQLVVGGGDAREERVVLALEPVGARGRDAGARPACRVDPQQQRAVGPQAAGGERVERRGSASTPSPRPAPW